MTDKEQDLQTKLKEALRDNYLRGHSSPPNSDPRFSNSEDFNVEFWDVLNTCLQEDWPIPGWVQDHLKQAANNVWNHGDFSMLNFRKPRSIGGGGALARYKKNLELELREAAKFVAKERGFKLEAVTLLVNKLMTSKIVMDNFGLHVFEVKERRVKDTKEKQGDGVYTYMFDKDLDTLLSDQNILNELKALYRKKPKSLEQILALKKGN